MAPDPDQLRNVSRRKFIVGVGAAGLGGIAGCSGDGDDTDTEGGNGNGDGTPTDSGMDTSPLQAGGSSTVYPVSNTAASYWGGNRPASDGEYWGSNDEGSVAAWDQLSTDKNLADYWAGLYGYEATEQAGSAPFLVSVNLSHSGTGVENCRDGIVDIGNSSGNVEDELPDRDSYDNFVDHITAVDGQPLVVSQEIADAGVNSITGDQLKDMYKGNLTNWSEVGGPDREIQVLARVKGSGTRTSFVSNVFGNPEEDTTVSNRFGQNQRLAGAIADADNAISYLALAFINEDGLAPVALEWEGTTYEYQADENGLDATSYPLSRDLHMYTWEDTSEKEAAFIRMCLHPFGQETFVKPNNYFALSTTRRQEELDKLPETMA